MFPVPVADPRPANRTAARNVRSLNGQHNALVDRAADPPRVGMEHLQVHLVPVDSVHVGESPRLLGEDPQHVHMLTELVGRLPPLLVHRPTMRVIDGRHRLLAARLQERETIEVRFVDGDETEAFVLAVEANNGHGLPLTLADREAAALRIIAARPHASDRSIAAITGLAPRTIGSIRRRNHPDGSPSGVRIGRDGRVRPLSSADGRRIASETISRYPNASLREVARVAGISPGTVRDVRDRIARGDDPVPPRLRGVESRPGAGRSDTSGDRPLRDRTLLLQQLSRDPALRFNDTGRKLLRWLFAQANGPEGWEELMQEIPPHSGYVIAEVARGCASAWREFAETLEQRLQVPA